MKAVAFEKHHKTHAIAPANKDSPVVRIGDRRHKLDRIGGDRSKSMPRGIYHLDERRIGIMDDAGIGLHVFSDTEPEPKECDASISIELARKANNGVHTIGLAATPSNGVSIVLDAQKRRQRHILCVDDEIIATNARAEILGEYGYIVHVCNSPIESLHCDLASFDLAIVDFQMPVLNGRDLLLRMRSRGARFPVILLTGDLGALRHEDCVLFSRCIDKIAPIDSLLDSIDEFLGPNQVSDYGS